MISELKKHKRWNEIKLLFAVSIFCFGLTIFRFWYTETKLFLFLNWNLFLAFVPWAVTTYVVIFEKKTKLKYSTVLFLLANWLLFFPNAPYILTDLFHLKTRDPMPLWYDLILILSYAWAGLLFGMLSLLDIENHLKNYLSPKKLNLVIAGLIFLSSFGIYLGRYLRWNSWDIVQEPLDLAGDVVDRFINPTAHPRTWGFTIFMGIFLNFIHWSLKLIQKRTT